jgi:peptide/nickel transport system permease protein
MIRLILFRVWVFIPTLVTASIILFIAINVVPGSAARAVLGLQATPQAIKRFEHKHGLDRPLYVQYVDWAGKAVKGDLGTSFQNSVAVGPEVLKRIPITLQLAGTAFFLALLIAIPLGSLAGLRHQKRADGLITTIATLFGSTPNFWLATLLVYFFSLKLGWFPTGGYIPFREDPVENIKGMVLPAISLGIVSSGLLIRIMRASVIESMESNYVETAKAKGAGDVRLLTHHIFRNSIIPFLTVGAVEFGFLVGSVVIIEDVFRIPGIGSLVLVGIINRDYPVLLAASMAVTVIVLVVNLMADLCSQLIDPRQVRTMER